MKALSIRQPWAWAILHAGKRIENRSWSTTYRGEILIHAGKTCTRSQFCDGLDFMHEQFDGEWMGSVPGLDRMQRGGIIGRARIIDVLAPGTCYDHTSLPARLDIRWHEPACYGFVLADIEPLPFTPCKGSLGLFNIDERILRAA